MAARNRAPRHELVALGRPNLEYGLRASRPHSTRSVCPRMSRHEVDGCRSRQQDRLRGEKQTLWPRRVMECILSKSLVLDKETTGKYPVPTPHHSHSSHGLIMPAVPRCDEWEREPEDRSRPAGYPHIWHAGQRQGQRPRSTAFICNVYGSH